MSNAYRIHGARFLRKYSAADRSSIYAYMSDVRKIASTLCEVPWSRVRADIPATTTIHTEEGLDWNTHERNRFDAAEWCGEHSDGFHRAFAQAACYVFKLPASAIGTAIEKISLQVTSDAYNPYGARIAAMTSATLDIPMDCATVREGEVFRAPDADGMGAAPRLFMRNKDGSQNWYSNTERVDLEPAEPLTAKQFLFVFVCLENYNRGRDGWIEGSSYIDNDVELTLGTACDDLVSGELNDCSSIESGYVCVDNLENGSVSDLFAYNGKITKMSKVTVTAGENSFDIIGVMGTDKSQKFGPIEGFVLFNATTGERILPGVEPLESITMFTDAGIQPESFALDVVFEKVNAEIVISVVFFFYGASQFNSYWKVDYDDTFASRSGEYFGQPRSNMARNATRIYDGCFIEAVGEGRLFVSEGFGYVALMQSGDLLFMNRSYPKVGDARRLSHVFKVEGGGVVRVLRYVHELEDGVDFRFVVVGSFKKIDGVDVNGFAIITIKNGDEDTFLTVSPMFRDQLAFDDWSNIDVPYYDAGLNTALITGDFSTVNGIEVNGAVIVSYDSADSARITQTTVLHGLGQCAVKSLTMTGDAMILRGEIYRLRIS
jgi:hypothetical protein